jgi:hypothetical protein
MSMMTEKVKGVCHPLSRQFFHEQVSSIGVHRLQQGRPARAQFLAERDFCTTDASYGDPP